MIDDVNGNTNTFLLPGYHWRDYGFNTSIIKFQEQQLNFRPVN